MKYLQEFIPLGVAAFWPVTVLIILWYFRKEIKDLIQRILKANFGGVAFEFGQAKSDLVSVEINAALPRTESSHDTTAPTDANWNKVASIFWLGSDLDWTAQTTLRGAPKERIIHGLTQAYHHASECGLSNAVPGTKLAAIRSRVQGTQEAALDRDWRSDFVEQLYGIIRGFSDLARGQQPDFRPGP